MAQPGYQAPVLHPGTAPWRLPLPVPTAAQQVLLCTVLGWLERVMVLDRAVPYSGSDSDAVVPQLQRMSHLPL